MVSKIQDMIKKHKAGRIIVCGSLRRGRQSIGDIDIVLETNQPHIVQGLFDRALDSQIVRIELDGI